MSNEAEILPNLLREETFEIAMRGYNRHQVDEYISRTRNQIRDLEARLSRALDEVERTRREMAEVREARRPTGDELGDRLRQIINLAEEEAQSKLGDADQRVSQIRKDAEQEAKRIVDEARGMSEQTIAQAQEKAEQALSAARQEADKTLSAAKKEAEQTLTNARTEAERTLHTAERRSAVINEGATDRLSRLTRQHSQALDRLTEINETLTSALRAEQKAGPLEQMVSDAVTKAAQRAAKPIRPERPERPENRQPSPKQKPGQPIPIPPGGPETVPDQPAAMNPSGHGFPPMRHEPAEEPVHEPVDDQAQQAEYRPQDEHRPPEPPARIIQVPVSPEDEINL
jgi:cell division septum initiation protein DivIVA